MTEDNYDLIKASCTKYIAKKHWDTHLEDCIQYVCLRWLEKEKKNDGHKSINLKWAVCDYFRLQGMSGRRQVKSSARPLAMYDSIDAPSKGCVTNTGEEILSQALLDDASIEKSELQEHQMMIRLEMHFYEIEERKEYEQLKRDRLTEPNRGFRKETT